MLNNVNYDIDITKEPPADDTARQYYFIEKAKAYVQRESEELGRPLTFCVTTFGCQMNARDSEKLVGILRKIGYAEEEKEENADFVIYNTCTVRENANLRVYGRLGQLGSIKKKNPHKMIALCGCMMQEPEVVEKLKKSYRFVDLIFGTHNIYKFAELLTSAIQSDRTVIDIWKDTDKIVEDLPVERKYPFKSGVNIMFGCNNFCSYCIVPYVRGRERSREPKAIIREIERLVADGVVEVMLLGQNVNSYGKNLEEPMTFAQLLQEIEKIEGLERIRFMTSHPKDLSDELIEVMGKSKKICKHLHLPVQSGSSRILKKMNRHYTKEDYLTLVDKIKTACPDMSLTTDIIVGFPGETEEDFIELKEFIEEFKFDYVGVFKYSREEDTEAHDLLNQVDDETKERRYVELVNLQSQIAENKNKQYIGKEIEVMIDSISSESEFMLEGRTKGQALEIDGKVLTNDGTGKPGEIVKVLVEQNFEYDLLGPIIRNEDN